MQHTDHLSKTEKSIYYVIETLRCYTEHGFIASLDLRNYSDLNIQKLTECLTLCERSRIRTSGKTSSMSAWQNARISQHK